MALPAALTGAGPSGTGARATPPGAPALVVYGCADAAGLAAAPAVRRVTVYDPCQERGEATCEAGAAAGGCSVGGSCEAALASSFAAAASSANTTTAGPTVSVALVRGTQGLPHISALPSPLPA